MVIWMLIGCCLTGCMIGYMVMIVIATSAFRDLKIPTGVQRPFISVVVAARNEEQNLPGLLEAISKQSYPGKRFEVILVDDHSEDNSADVVSAWNSSHPDTPVLFCLSDGRGKKAALTTGIIRAQGEWILQTDADCLPTSGWMSTMATGMEDDIHFLSGPIRLREGNSWLTRLQALEMVGLVTLGAGSMAAGFPNMANGANMAYRKKTFMEMGGFQGSAGVASGDDEFLVQAISKRYPKGLRFVKDPQTIIETDAAQSWLAFRAQRIRWVSKARFYEKRSTNLIQMMSWLGFVAFPYWLILGFFHSGGWMACLGLFLAKVGVDHWLMKSGTVFLQRRKWMRWLLLLEIGYIPYVIWIGVRGNISSAYSWKGRQTA